MIGHIFKILDRKKNAEDYLYGLILDKFVVGNIDYLIIDENHYTFTLDGGNFIAIPLQEQLSVYKKYFNEYIILPEHLKQYTQEKI